jgi:predicted  nucleic acid-binding Zn-ribbon protein
MAALAGAFDHSLEERIYHLQKLSTDPETRRVLEEAMRLCGDGHHLEAAALIEKAEAMSQLPSGPRVAPSPEKAAGKRSLGARLAGDIADGLTNVLVRAIEDLERHITAENGQMSATFAERLDKLQSSVESLQPLHDRLDQLVSAGVAAQEKVEELAATTASLREAHARLDTDVAALRQTIDQLSASTSNRVDEACRRIEGQEREISQMNSGFSDLASKVAAAAERLERHANAIRTIHDSHQERTAVLGQVGELLDRLKSAPVPPEPASL